LDLDRSRSGIWSPSVKPQPRWVATHLARYFQPASV